MYSQYAISVGSALSLNKQRSKLAFAMVGLLVLTVASFSLLLFPNVALAAKPSDFGLHEGDIVSAAGSSDPDVYIVNEYGYKRLFLNPAIFNFYGHLGGFVAVKNISSATRDAFGTSGLFRNCETNDPKIYGVEITGEDTGLLHWVNISGSQAVAEDPDFFRKVFCVNNNEFSWYPKGPSYSSVSQIPSYSRMPIAASPVPTPQINGMLVSLSPNNPGARTITLNAQGVDLMVVRFNGQGTVQSLKFKRGGPGSINDYDNLYVYDGAKRLTNGRSPSSADGTVTFANLKLDVNGTKEIILVADHSGTAGNVNYWDLIEAGTLSGNINGAPIRSNAVNFSGANSGTVNIDKNGLLSNPKVGQKNSIVSEFKISSNLEDARIRRIQLVNGGTVRSSDITNMRIEVNNTTVVAGVMTNDGAAVFDFGIPGFRIAKGDSRIFKVFADIAGRKDETVSFYLEQSGDVLAIGDQFGFGMKSIVDNNFDDSTNTHLLVLQGGIVTLSFNGPGTSNIVDRSQDVPLLRYSITAERNVELRKHQIVLCVDKNGNGIFDPASGNFSDLEDIKIKNEDTGGILAGPFDGSAFTISDTSCPGAIAGLRKELTDTIDLPAGKTINLAITVDIKTSNSSDSSTALGSGDVIKAVLKGYGNLVGISGNVSIARYSGSNTPVISSDFVPSGNISGNNLTIGASSLSLSLAGTPSSNAYSIGSKDVDALGVIFEAALGAEVNVTSIKLTGYVSDDNVVFAKSLGLSAPDNSLTVQGLISSVKLYDGGSGQLISATPSSNNLNTSISTISFNNLNWRIPAGESKRLLVRVDTSTNAPSGSFDGFAFDVASTADVAGVDLFGAAVNASNASVNGGSSPLVKMKVSTGGAVTVSLSPNSPNSEAKYWGQKDTEFSRFRITSSGEAQLVERIILTTGDFPANLAGNVKNVYITYTNKVGNTLTSSGIFNASGSVSFAFAGDNRPYVPKDSNLDIVVKADMKTNSEGATSEKTFSIDFSKTFNGSNTNGFRAIGEGSGKVITGSDVNNVAGKDMLVYRVFPKFEQVTILSGEPVGTKDAARFTITAMGLPDSKLLFDGISSGSIRFEVIASGGANANVTVRIYDANDGTLYSTNTITNAQSLSPNASLSIDFNNRDLEIGGGLSKTFRIEVDFRNFTEKSDFFQIVLRDDENGLIKWVDNSTGSVSDAMAESIVGFLKMLPMNGQIFTRM